MEERHVLTELAEVDLDQRAVGPRRHADGAPGVEHQDAWTVRPDATEDLYGRHARLRTVIGGRITSCFRWTRIG